MNKIVSAIGLSKKEVETINKRLSADSDWKGTQSEWQEYIKRLIMDDIGNL